MRKQLIIIASGCALALGGCAQTVKSPDEPLETQAKVQEDKRNDLLKPNVDYEKAARLYIELGLAYLRDGQVGRAKTKLLRAEKLAPQLPAVHYAMGFYKEAVGETKQANKHFKKAIEKDPIAGDSHNNYGTFLCRQGQYKQAEKEFLLATQDPNYTQVSEALENAGLCTMQIPDIAKATEYFEKAVRMDTRRVEALLELAIIKYNQGVFSEAAENYSLYHSQAQPTSRSLWVGIKIAEHFNDKDKAASLRLLLKNKFPQSAEAQDIFGTKVNRG